MVCIPIFFFVCFIFFQLDTISTNTPTTPPGQDNKQLSPLPIVANEQGYNPIISNPPKRSNMRKNQYGDEVYD